MSLGLKSIQNAIGDLQREISHLTPSPTNEVVNIRQRHINAKIESLNQAFFTTLENVALTSIEIIIRAMEYVEDMSYRYANLLDVSNTGSFKQELVLILLRDALKFKTDEVILSDNDIQGIIDVIVRCTKGLIIINPKPPTPPVEEEIQDLSLVKYEKNKKHGKLNKWLVRSQHRHTGDN